MDHPLALDCSLLPLSYGPWVVLRHAEDVFLIFSTSSRAMPYCRCDSSKRSETTAGGGVGRQSGTAQEIHLPVRSPAMSHQDLDLTNGEQRAARVQFIGPVQTANARTVQWNAREPWCTTKAWRHDRGPLTGER